MYDETQEVDDNKDDGLGTQLDTEDVSSEGSAESEQERDNGEDES